MRSFNRTFYLIDVRNYRFVALISNKTILFSYIS